MYNSSLNGKAIQTKTNQEIQNTTRVGLRVDYNAIKASRTEICKYALDLAAFLA